MTQTSEQERRIPDAIRLRGWSWEAAAGIGLLAALVFFVAPTKDDITSGYANIAGVSFGILLVVYGLAGKFLTGVEVRRDRVVSRMFSDALRRREILLSEVTYVEPVSVGPVRYLVIGGSSGCLDIPAYEFLRSDVALFCSRLRGALQDIDGRKMTPVPDWVLKKVRRRTVLMFAWTSIIWGPILVLVATFK
jgi:hypothetical protein